MRASIAGIIVLLATLCIAPGCSFFKQSKKTETHQYQTLDGGYTSGSSVTWPAPAQDVKESEIKKAKDVDTK